MYLSTDILDKLRHGGDLRLYVCVGGILGFNYLKMKEQSQERYEYIVGYNQDLHFGSNRLYTALFIL